jgi:hypothetical protein
MTGGMDFSAPAVQHTSMEAQMRMNSVQDARNMTLSGGKRRLLRERMKRQTRRTGQRTGQRMKRHTKRHTKRHATRHTKRHAKRHTKHPHCAHPAHVPCTSRCRVGRSARSNRRTRRTRGILRKSRLGRTRQHPKDKRRVRWRGVGGVVLAAGADQTTQRLAQMMANVNAAKQVV